MNPRTKSQDIRDLSQNDIRELVAELGQPAFRAKQLIEWVFEKNVCSFDDMTNLPKAFREQLKEAFAFDTPTELTKQVSAFPPRQAVAWAVPFVLPGSTASSAL